MLQGSFHILVCSLSSTSTYTHTHAHAHAHTHTHTHKLVSCGHCEATASTKHTFHVETGCNSLTCVAQPPAEWKACFCAMSHLHLPSCFAFPQEWPACLLDFAALQPQAGCLAPPPLFPSSRYSPQTDTLSPCLSLSLSLSLSFSLPSSLASSS